MHHDHLFKKLLDEFFADFLALFVPKLAAQLEEPQLVPLDKELLGEAVGTSRREVDFLVRARLRGQAATFLIHVEAQAKFQRNFAQRMFRYFVLLSAKHDEPVYPIAVLTYAKPKAEAKDTYMITLAERNIICFQFQVVQLNRCNWQEFRARENAAAAALMTQMNIAPADRPLVKQVCYEIIQRLKLTEEQKQFLAGYVEHYMHLDERENTIFMERIKAAAPAVREVVMELSNQWVDKGRREGRQEAVKELSNQWIDKGRREGRQEAVKELSNQWIEKGRKEAVKELSNQWIEKGRKAGRQAGRHEAALNVVLALIGRRFGQVAEATRETLTALPAEHLEKLAVEIPFLPDLEALAEHL
jgi:plasmid maintenance system killer protein